MGIIGDKEVDNLTISIRAKEVKKLEKWILRN
jgi:hypothetical protein